MNRNIKLTFFNVLSNLEEYYKRREQLFGDKWSTSFLQIEPGREKNVLDGILETAIQDLRKTNQLFDHPSEDIGFLLRLTDIEFAHDEIYEEQLQYIYGKNMLIYQK